LGQGLVHRVGRACGFSRSSAARSRSARITSRLSARPEPSFRSSGWAEAVQRIEAAQVLQPLQQGLLDVVFADEVLRGGHGTSLVLPVVEKKTC
jgi:hypothetical protein